MRRARPRCCARPTGIANATSAAAAASTAATVSIAATVTAARGVSAATTPKPRRSRSKHHAIRSLSGTPSVLPPPQDVSVLRQQRAEDRLQGREAVAALRFGTRQDRAEPHHRGLDQEATRACARDQAGALSRAAELRDQVARGQQKGAPFLL